MYQPLGALKCVNLRPVPFHLGAPGNKHRVPARKVWKEQSNARIRLNIADRVEKHISGKIWEA